MATFILVHGSFHGGWCWVKVVNLLKGAGHQVLAPDLPGLGIEAISPKDVTLEMTGCFIADLAKRQGEKVILVGHSLGGVAISDAAERAPEAIAGLVYVAALLLPQGGSAMGLMGGKIPDGIALSRCGYLLTIDPEVARGRYYSGCEDFDQEQAVARLGPQPIGPLQDELAITPERFGSVRRAYIECLQDNALSLSLQRSQHQATPCSPILAMDTGHSPFMQDPDTFTAHLTALADAFDAGR